MSDDKKKRGEPDSSRISLNEKYEMEYWKNKLNVSSQRLSGAVRAVGNNPKDVEEYLAAKWK